jgi:hypothetical protein
MSSSTTSSVTLAAVSAACMPKLRVRLVRPAAFRVTYSTMLACDSSVGIVGFVSEAAHLAPEQN